MTFILLGVLGLIIGSFLNVLIYRIPRGEGIVFERSHCTHCLKPLAWYDLVPLLSFLLLRGRCRQCKTSISWRYPLVELLSAFVFVSVYAHFMLLGWATIALTIFALEILLVFFFTDFLYYIIPDRIVLFGIFTLLVFAILDKFSLIYLPYDIFSANHFMAAILGFIFVYIPWLISRGRWIGLGDGKLLAFIGLWLGMLGGILVLYGAVFFGLIAGLIVLVSHRGTLKSRLPLGSFIEIGRAHV